MPRYRWQCPECGPMELLMELADRRLLREHGDVCAACGTPSRYQTVYATSGAGIMFANVQQAAASDTVLYSEAERREFLETNPNIVEIAGEQIKATGHALRDKQERNAIAKGFANSQEQIEHQHRVSNAIRHGAQRPKMPTRRDREEAMAAQGQGHMVGNTLYRIPGAGRVDASPREKSGHEIMAQEAFESKVIAASRKLGVAG